MKRDDVIWIAYGTAFLILEYKVSELSPTLRKWLGVHPRGKRYPYTITGYLCALGWLARHIVFAPKGNGHEDTR